jgi:hypothetical protein
MTHCSRSTSDMLENVAYPIVSEPLSGIDDVITLLVTLLLEEFSLPLSLFCV